ncbi:MAG: hypothetical protein J6Q38_01015 [Clostridia bacterium]|nr:hypothetical protein [Clostridia bacterium]
MKKISLFLLSVYIFTFTSLIPIKEYSAASENYMRVLSNGVYVYTDNTFTNKIFLVPYSYYVKVEGVNGNVVRVSYGDDDGKYPVIMGYSKLEELTQVDYVPLSPFSVLKVSSNLSDVLFNDSNLTKAYFNVPENTFMVYYGDFISENGNEIAYVYCSNKLGYFDKASLNPFTVPVNSDAIIQEPEINDNKEQDSQEENEKPSSLPAETLQIIIIIGLSVISISIVYALFKPNKSKSSNQEFFNEE